MSNKNVPVTRRELEILLCCLRNRLPSDGATGPTGPVGPIGVTGPAGADGNPADCDCGLQVYMSNGAVIFADALGITFDHSVGSGVVTIPNGVHLISFGLHGSLSFLNNGNYDLEFVYQGSTGVNNAPVSLWLPNIDVIEASTEQVGGPSVGLPFQYTGTQTLNAPQRQVLSVGSNNLKLRVANLDSYSNWLLKFSF